jgi:hypothetical protein
VTPLASTDPSDIANAARCFSSCLGAGSLQSSVNTYLLTQVAGIATPPCITPTAPINPTAKVITNTTIRIIWNQLSNSGSFILGYTVKWGTVSGVYTNTATVPVTPKLYTITGLTAGTQYFFVVVANSFAGCSSGNSAEASATTTGSSPANGLLTGLVSYWKEDSPDWSVDSKDGNTFTVAGGTGNAAGGEINGYFGLTGGLNNGLSLSPAPANLKLGAGISFGISMWIKPDNAQPNAQADIASQYSGAFVTSAYLIDIAAAALDFHGYSAASTQAVIHFGAQPSNAWHHLVIGFDSVNHPQLQQSALVRKRLPALTCFPVDWMKSGSGSAS